MTDNTPSELVACAECGAAVPRGEPSCWLCGHLMSATAPVAAKPTHSAAHTALNIGAVLIVGLFVLILIGAAQDDPGSALGLLILAVPGLLATVIASTRGRVRGKPLTFFEKVAYFTLSTAAVLSALVVIAVAAFVAFFAWCLFALGSGQMH